MGLQDPVLARGIIWPVSHMCACVHACMHKRTPASTPHPHHLLSHQVKPTQAQNKEHNRSCIVTAPVHPRHNSCNPQSMGTKRHIATLI